MIRIKLMVVIGLCAIVSGCITRADRQYAHVDNGAKSVVRKSIAYNLRCVTHTTTNGKFDKRSGGSVLTGAFTPPVQPKDADCMFRYEFGPDALTINSEADRLSKDSDIHMEIIQQNVWNPLACIGACISGFTWMIIPCWADDTNYLYAEVRRNDGKKCVYQLGGVVHTYAWLPFIFAVPFDTMPNTRMHEVAREQWHELHMRMRADGFFDEIQ